MLTVYMPFTSSSLMVSNFTLCGIPFLAGFYFRDVFYEKCEYVWFVFITCVYGFNGLLFFPFVLCGDINFVPSYSMLETS
jgi:NADH:ubiquinone oxidoreductase subunit 5 (subunit L)/multisubunit Na+/H+ antiporter MnhA subunit